RASMIEPTFFQGSEMPARRTSVRRRATSWRAVAVVLPGLLAFAVGAPADQAAGGAATSTSSVPKSASPATPETANPLGAAGPVSAGVSATGAASNAPAANGGLSKPPDAIPFEPLPEVSIEAPEPRYVAPTLRDRIGRIWAPVLIDGKGPFRLVLDTGANHSAVTAGVARALGIPLGETHVLLHGVMGTVAVPTIHVENLIVGDLQIDSTMLPIVPDALGGAQGVLGTEGLLDKRIFIDFRHDLIMIRRSHGQRGERGYVTVPVRILPNHLLATTAYVGSIRTTAIIDTGAQTSIANIALRDALLGRRRHYEFTKDQIVDTTDTVGEGQGADVPPIRLGSINIRSAHLTIGDIEIFQAWKLADRPALLIGMDALGTVDVLVIDYRRSELQILARGAQYDDDPLARFRDPRW